MEPFFVFQVRRPVSTHLNPNTRRCTARSSLRGLWPHILPGGFVGVLCGPVVPGRVLAVQHLHPLHASPLRVHHGQQPLEHAEATETRACGQPDPHGAPRRKVS